MIDTKPLLTPDEVAEYLRLAPDTVYRYIRQGKLVATRMGRQYRIRREDVQALLARRERTPSTAEPRAAYDVTPTRPASPPRLASDAEPYLLPIPRDVLIAARLTPEQALIELAVHLYAENRLSFGKAHALANLSVWEFRQILGSRRIPAHYGLEDLKQDEETVEWLMSRDRR